MTKEEFDIWIAKQDQLRATTDLHTSGHVLQQSHAELCSLIREYRRYYDLAVEIAKGHSSVLE